MGMGIFFVKKQNADVMQKKEILTNCADSAQAANTQYQLTY